MEIQKIEITEEERQLLSSFIGEEYEGHEIDFNRLMPVVEKIELLGWSWQPSVWRKDNTISNYQSLFTHSKEKAVSGESKVKIESVWLAVVQFIKWHNSLTSK